MNQPDDSLDAIASDLDQLADETAGNESRPSAEDICARARQAAKRVRAMDLRLMPTPLQQAPKPTHPVVGPYEGAFIPGKPLTTTHPRALGDVPAAYETPAERHAAALGEDYQAGADHTIEDPLADVLAHEAESDDPPVEPDPADQS